MENEKELIVFELESYEIFGSAKLDANSYLKGISNECIDKYSARDSLLTVQELALGLTSEIDAECKVIEAQIDKKLNERFGTKSFYSLARKCSH